MANMGYCRFQNTLKDLRDCRDEFASLDSTDEAKAAVKLFELCEQIVSSYDVADLRDQLDELVAEDEAMTRHMEEPV